MLGIVTGFSAEAALLAQGPWRVAMAGGRPDRAVELARALVADGCSALVSFGIAGGLAPGLAPGTLVVGEAVVHGGRRLVCSPDLLHGVSARRGVVAAADGVVADPAAKAALFAATGALAVDLESWGVAEAADQAGLPFAVLRAVADPAERALPRAAAEGLDEHGNVRLGAVLLSLLKDPRQLPGLVRVGLDTRAALAALKRAVAGMPHQ
jgi:hopanoid-associated phosphorylase